MIKGDMALHYLTSDGEERIANIREGEIIHCPAGTPHSPRFAPDSYVGGELFHVHCMRRLITDDTTRLSRALSRRSRELIEQSRRRMPEGHGSSALDSS